MNALSYLKNVGKSFGYAAVDIYKDLNPTTSSYIAQSKEFSQDLFQSVKSFTASAKEANNNPDSLLGLAKSTAKDTIANSISDLRSGKWYNKQRSDEEIGGTFAQEEGMDIDLDFDWDDDDDDDAKSSPEQTTMNAANMLAGVNTKNSISEIKAMDRVGRKMSAAIGMSTIQSAQYMGEVNKTGFKQMLKLNNKGFAGVMSGISAVNANISSLGQPITTHINNAATFYAKTNEWQESVISKLDTIITTITPKRRSSSRTTDTIFDLMNADGAIDFNAMKNLIVKNAKDSTVGSYLSMFTTMVNPKEIAAMIKSNPIGFLLKAGMSASLSSNFKESQKRIDKAISQLSVGFLNKLRKGTTRSQGGIRSDSDSIFGRLFDSFLDLLTPKNAYIDRIDTSNYEKGKVDWDGKSRKALIEVIPTYLAEIDAALTGKPVRMYDFNSGTWKTMTTIKSNFESMRTNVARNNSGSYVNGVLDIAQGMVSDKKMTEAQKSQLEKELTEFVTKSYHSNGTDYQKVAANYKSSKESDKAYKEYGKKMGLSKEAWDLLQLYNKVLSENGKLGARNQLETDIETNRGSWGRQLKNMGENDSIYQLLFNGMSDYNLPGKGKDVANTKSATKNANNPFMNLRDEYNNNVFFYLQNIFRATDYLARNANTFVSPVAFDTSGNGNHKDTVRLSPAVDLSFRSYKPYSSEIRRTPPQKNTVADDKEAEEEEKKKNNKQVGISSNIGRYTENDIQHQFNKNSGFDEDQYVKDNITKNANINDSDKLGAISYYEQRKRNPSIPANKKYDDIINKASAGKDIASKAYRINSNWKGLFGNSKAGKAIDNITDSLANGFEGIVSDWIYSNVPFAAAVKNAFVGQKNSNGEYSGKLFSKFANDFDKAKLNARGKVFHINQDEDEEDTDSGAGSGLYGLSAGKSKKKKKNRSKENPVVTQIKSEAKDILDEAKEKTDQVVEVVEDKASNAKDKVQSTLNQTINSSTAFIKTVVQETYGQDGKYKNAGKNIQNVQKIVQAGAKDAGLAKGSILTGAIIGGGAGLLTGSIIGPIAGAAIGAGVGLVKKSTKIQNLLFGEIVDEKTGARSEGMLPRKLSDFILKNSSAMAHGGRGAIAGMVGGTFLGSPIIGAIAGAAAGFVSHSAGASAALFGEEDDNGNKIKLGFFNKLFKNDKSSKRLKLDKAIGGVGGAIAGSMLLHNPLGIAGGIIIGSAISMSNDMSSFKEKMFGKEVTKKDKDGKEYKTFEGGLFGLLKTQIVDPLAGIINKGANMLSEDFKNLRKKIVKDIRRKLAKKLLPKIKNIASKTKIGRKTTQIASKLKKTAIKLNPLNIVNNALEKRALKQGYVFNDNRGNYVDAGDRLKRMKDLGMNTDTIQGQFYQILQNATPEEAQVLSNILLNGSEPDKEQTKRMVQSRGIIAQMLTSTKADQANIQRMKESSSALDKMFAEKGSYTNAEKKKKIKKYFNAGDYENAIKAANGDKKLIEQIEAYRDAYSSAKASQDKKNEIRKQFNKGNYDKAIEAANGNENLISQIQIYQDAKSKRTKLKSDQEKALQDLVQNATIGDKIKGFFKGGRINLNETQMAILGDLAAEESKNKQKQIETKENSPIENAKATKKNTEVIAEKTTDILEEVKKIRDSIKNGKKYTKGRRKKGKGGGGEQVESEISGSASSSEQPSSNSGLADNIKELATEKVSGKIQDALSANQTAAEDSSSSEDTDKALEKAASTGSKFSKIGSFFKGIGSKVSGLFGKGAITNITTGGGGSGLMKYYRNKFSAGASGDDEGDDVDANTRIVNTENGAVKQIKTSKGWQNDQESALTNKAEKTAKMKTQFYTSVAGYGVGIASIAASTKAIADGLAGSGPKKKGLFDNLKDMLLGQNGLFGGLLKFFTGGTGGSGLIGTVLGKAGTITNAIKSLIGPAIAVALFGEAWAGKFDSWSEKYLNTGKTTEEKQASTADAASATDKDTGKSISLAINADGTPYTDSNGNYIDAKTGKIIDKSKLSNIKNGDISKANGPSWTGAVAENSEGKQIAIGMNANGKPRRTELGGYMGSNSEVLNDNIRYTESTATDSLSTRIKSQTVRGLLTNTPTLASATAKAVGKGLEQASGGRLVTQGIARSGLNKLAGKALETGLTQAAKSTMKGASKQVIEASVKDGTIGGIASMVQEQLQSLFEKLSKLPWLKGCGDAVQEAGDDVTKTAVNAVEQGGTTLATKVASQIIDTALFIAKIATVIYDFEEGYNDAYVTLHISKPSVPQKILSGIIRAVKNCIPFIGLLIPDSTLVNTVVKYIAPALGIDTSSFLKQQQAADEELSNYNNANNTNYTWEEYQKQVKNHYTLGERVRNGVKTAGAHIANGVKKVPSAIKKGASTAVSAVGKGLKATGKFIKNTAGNVVNGVSDIFSNFVASQQQIIKYTNAGDISGLISSKYSDTKASKDDSNGMSSFFNGFYNISKIVNVPIAGISWVGHKVGDFLGNVIGTAKIGFTDLAKNNARQLKSIINGDPISLMDEHWQSKNEDNPLSQFFSIGFNIRRISLLPITLLSWVGHKVGEKIASFFQTVGTAVKGLGTIQTQIADYDKSGDVTGLINSKFEEVNKDDPLNGFYSAMYTISKFINTPIAGISWVGHKIGDGFTSFIDGAKNLFGASTEGMATVSKYVKSGDVTGLIGATYKNPDENNPMNGVASALFQVDKFLSVPAAGISWVGHKIGDGFASTISGAKNLFSAIGTSITTASNFVKSGDINGLIKADFKNPDENNPMNGIASALFQISKIVNVPAAGISWAGHKISNGFNRIVGNFSTNVSKLSKALDTMEKAASDGKLGTVTKTSVSFDSGNGIMNGLFSVIGTIGKIIFSTVAGVNKIVKGIQKAGNAIGSIPKKVEKAVDKLTGKIKSAFGASDSSSSGSGSGLTGIAGGSSFISQKSSSYAGRKLGNHSVGDMGCGPASAAMAVGGSSMDGAIDSAKRYQTSGGTDAAFFGDYFRSHGRRANYMNNTNAIARSIASGTPTVLMGRDASNTSKANSPFGPRNHYVVAKGFDHSGNVIVNDPEQSHGNTKYSSSILKNVVLGVGAGKSGVSSKRKRRKGFMGVSAGTSFFNEANTEAIWKYFISQGLSPYEAAGILGNWQSESGVNPDSIEADYLFHPNWDDIMKSPQSAQDYTLNKLFPSYASSGISINKSAYIAKDGYYYPGAGIAAWTGPKVSDLLNYAKANNVKSDSLSAQIGFFLNGPDEYNGTSSYRKKLNAAMKGANSPTQAADYFYSGYERGINVNSGYRNSTRESNAQNIYNKFKDVKGDASAIQNVHGSSSSSSGSSDSNNPGILGTILNAFGAIGNVLNGGTSSSDSSDSSSASSYGIDSSKDPVSYMKSILGTISYSMSGPRNPDMGSADCSSTVAWAIKKAGGPDIGGYTGSQQTSPTMDDVANARGATLTQDQLGGANYSKLKRDDLLFFVRDYAKGNSAYPYGVGHVGLYMGDGQYIDHGSGMGPQIKSMPGSGLTLVRRMKSEYAPWATGSSSSSSSATPLTAVPVTSGSGSGLSNIQSLAYDYNSDNYDFGMSAGDSGLMESAKNLLTSSNTTSSSIGASGKSFINTTSTPTSAINLVNNAISSSNKDKSTALLLRTIITLVEQLVDNTDKVNAIYNVIAQNASAGGSGMSTEQQAKVLALSKNYTDNSIQGTSNANAQRELSSLKNTIDKILAS